MPDLSINRILIVRLSALGDIIHALPVAAALREAFPAARIDWLVSERHREILGYVPVVDRRVVLERSWRAAVKAVAQMRRADYDIAFDLQGLLKSAVLARASGARRVVGFAAGHVRERGAQLFYTEAIEPPAGVHVVDKNIGLLAAVGLRDVPKRFPLDTTAGPASPGLKPGTGEREGPVRSGFSRISSPESPFALLNPAAGWPNKRWPPERFGAIAARLRAGHGLPSLVLWGPGEERLAQAVVDASEGAAALAPPTGLAQMIDLARTASLLVSGDTGPLHSAAAVGTPVVGIYGPTSPARNGPWDSADVCVSRFDACRCHHRRRCRLPVCCLDDILVEEVMAAIERRLGRSSTMAGGGARTSARDPESRGAKADPHA